MRTKTKSLILSRILTAAATVLIIIMTFFVPFLSQWYNESYVVKGFIKSVDITAVMIILLYLCEAFGLTAISALHILLSNISNDNVFVIKNIICLRVISWSCMFAGCAFFILGLWSFIFWTAAFFAFMLGLIIRVLKNVFEKTVEIKSENDFTI